MSGCRAALPFLLCLAAVTAVAGAEQGPGPVVTFERVWYKSGHKWTGDLTVTDEGLTFSHRDKTVFLPMERIRVVSFGKMKGDVDSDWAVLGLGEGDELVGFRDGRKLGFGGHTERIYEAIKSAVRRATAAQYDAPPGFRPYDEFDWQFTMAVPRDWKPDLQSLIYSDGRPSGGTILFSPEQDASAFFVERERAGRSMSCKGLPEGAREDLLERARRDPIFLEDDLVPELAAPTSVRVDGCDGWHLLARSRGPEAEERLLELYAVARGGTFYVFGLRAVGGDGNAVSGPFATVISTVRFSVAR